MLCISNVTENMCNHNGFGVDLIWIWSNPSNPLVKSKSKSSHFEMVKSKSTSNPPNSGFANPNPDLFPCLVLFHETP